MSAEIVLKDDEKRLPIALIFYDGAKDYLQFEIVNSTPIEEAVAILKRYFPTSKFEQDGIRL